MFYNDEKGVVVFQRQSVYIPKHSVQGTDMSKLNMKTIE